MHNAYAVKSSGEIIIATVSPSERAAMVNWLVVCAGVPVTSSWLDIEIAHEFESRAHQWGARVVPVIVSEAS